MPRLFACILIVALTAMPTLAAAAEPPFTFEGELGVVSDYRYRGISLSGHDPAVQGGLTVTHSSGVYVNGWASNIEEYGAGVDGKGAKVEIDAVLGWSGAVGGLDVDASVQAYLYPGGSDVNYVEIPLSISKTVGALTWSAGAAYAPSQKALGHEDNIYGWAGLSWGGDDAPLKLDLQAGYEDGAYAPGGKWDWSAGVSHAFGPVTAGVAYVDSDRSGATAVVSLTASF